MYRNGRERIFQLQTVGIDVSRRKRYGHVLKFQKYERLGLEFHALKWLGSDLRDIHSTITVSNFIFQISHLGIGEDWLSSYPVGDMVEAVI